MKKVFRLFTVFAVILAMVMPVTVMAEDIDLASVETLTVTYVVKDAGGNGITEAHPGDTIIITAMAQMSATEKNFDLVSGVLSFDNTVLTPVADTDTKTTENSSFIYYYNNAADLAVGTTETPVFSYTFKVAETAAASTTISNAVPSGDIREITFSARGDNDAADPYESTRKNLIVTPTTLTIAQNEIEVTVDGATVNAGNLGTYFKSSIDVAVDGTNLTSATITKADDDTFLPINLLTQADKKATLNKDGAYTVTVVAPGRTETYTFTLHTAPVSATIDNQIDPDMSGLGYQYGEAVTIPVKIKLEGDATAAMVSFAVDYDTDVFDLAFTNTNNLVKQEAGKIVYGDADSKEAEKALANGATITTITLTVKDGVAYGNYEIGFTGTDIALYSAAAPSTSETKLGLEVTQPKQIITVVPTVGAEATFGDLPNRWKNDSQEVTITPAENVNLIYGHAKEGLAAGADQAALKAAFEAADATPVASADGKLTADTEETYYLIAKIGTEPNAVYRLVRQLTPSELKLDQTAPKNINVTTDLSGWKQAVTILASEITTDSDLSGINTDALAYRLDTDAADQWTPVGSEGIQINKNFNGTMTIKVVDYAGNYATKDVTVQVDVDAPEVKVTSVGEMTGEGTRMINFTASDALSGLWKEADADKTYAAVYFTTNAEQKNLDSVAAIEAAFTGVNPAKSEISSDGTGTHSAEYEGTYYIVVTDNAGNKSFDKADVTFDKLEKAAALLVKTVETDDTFREGFLPVGSEFIVTDADGAKITHNGWFTSVTVAADNSKIDTDKYENTLTYRYAENETANYGEEQALVDGAKITTPGKYEVTVTTTHKTNKNDSQNESYEFVIVEVANVKSVTARNYYTTSDYARMKYLIASGKSLPTDAAQNFWGGLFSGDVTGDLKMTSADLDAIIRSVTLGETIGAQKSIPTMNLPKE